MGLVATSRCCVEAFTVVFQCRGVLRLRSRQNRGFPASFMFAVVGNAGCVAEDVDETSIGSRLPRVMLLQGRSTYVTIDDMKVTISSPIWPMTT